MSWFDVIMGIWDLADWAAEEPHHLFLAIVSGLLAFPFIWIMLSILRYYVRLFLKRWSVSRLVFITALVIVLLLGAVSYLALDYFTAWYTAPMGPPLELDLGGNTF